MPFSAESAKFHIYKSPADFLEAKKGEINQGRVFLTALRNMLSSIKEKCDNLALCTMVHPITALS